jgi:hypothetical protein
VTLPQPRESEIQQGRNRANWREDEVVVLWEWYTERLGRRLDIPGLAAKLGRSKASVTVKASRIGLTAAHRAAPRPIRSRAKYQTEEERRSAVGASTKAYIATNGHPRGARGLKHTPETLAKMHAGSKRWRESVPQSVKDEVTDRALATRLKRYGTLAPTFATSGANMYSRCKRGKRDDLGDMFFRSRWEANYARFLEFQKTRGLITSWEYEPTTFWFEAIRRGVRSYTPDFKIHTGTIEYYIEVKGWMDKKSRTKLARMRLYHPNIEIRLVGQREYRDLEKKLAGAIPNWEVSR